MHLVGLIIKKFVTLHGHMNEKLVLFFFFQGFTPKPCKHRLSLLLPACHMIPALSQIHHILVSHSVRALCVKRCSLLLYKKQYWMVCVLYVQVRTEYLFVWVLILTSAMVLEWTKRPLLCSHFSLWRKAKVFTGNIIHGIKIYYNPQAGFCIAQTVKVFDFRTGVIVWVFNSVACVTLLN